MKLKNKKTGEIKEVIVGGYPVSGKTKMWKCSEMDANEETGYKTLGTYNSLAELNAEWEDYKEPDEYWYIDYNGTVKCFQYLDYDWQEEMQAIGNYFGTREEAEKAVEKLRAWKLLKDECDIKFDGIIRDEKAMLKGVKLSYDRHTVTLARMRECMDALHLLFGSEE